MDETTSAAWGAIVLGGLLYFLPSFAAHRRRRHRHLQVVALNDQLCRR
jgi:hypothetical protein